MPFDRSEVGLEFEGILGDDDYDHDGGLQAWIDNDPYLQWGNNRGRGRQRAMKLSFHNNACNFSNKYQ